MYLRYIRKYFFCIYTPNKWQLWTLCVSFAFLYGSLRKTSETKWILNRNIPKNNITLFKWAFRWLTARSHQSFLETKLFWSPGVLFVGRKNTTETLWMALHHPNRSFGRRRVSGPTLAWSKCDGLPELGWPLVPQCLRPNRRPLKGFPDLSSKIRRFNDHFSSRVFQGLSRGEAAWVNVS